MPAITLTVVGGPAAGATFTQHDSHKPIKVGRVRTGNLLVVKDGETGEEQQQQRDPAGRRHSAC
jgi:hypothetical protein